MQHGCNEESLQSGSSSFHPFKKISLYLHALLVISRRTLSKNTQLGVLCQAALVVMYLLAIPFHMKLGGGGESLAEGLRARLCFLGLAGALWSTSSPWTAGQNRQ